MDKKNLSFLNKIKKASIKNELDPTLNRIRKSLKDEDIAFLPDQGKGKVINSLFMNKIKEIELLKQKTEYDEVGKFKNK